LLYVPVFVDGEIFIWGKAPQAEHILGRVEVKFTPEGSQRHETVLVGYVLLEYDIDFSFFGPDGMFRGTVQVVYNLGYPQRLAVQARRIDYPGGIRVVLPPMDGRRIPTENVLSVENLIILEGKKEYQRYKHLHIPIYDLLWK
jgi:hypothetical protein